MPEIVYTSNCDRCEAHKTEWGTFNNLVEKILGKPLVTLENPERLKLFEIFYNNMKLDERTQFISNQKKETTAQIQSYKVKNIKELQK